MMRLLRLLRLNDYYEIVENKCACASTICLPYAAANSSNIASIPQVSRGGIRADSMNHEAGSQPPFSLNSDHEQNKGVTSFISVVAYCAYILHSHLTYFFSLPHQDLEIIPKVLPGSWNPVSSIQRGFAHFHRVQIIPSKTNPVT